MEQKNESKKEVLICNWDSTGWKYNGGRGKRKIKENFFLIGKKKKKKKTLESWNQAQKGRERGTLCPSEGQQEIVKPMGLAPNVSWEFTYTDPKNTHGHGSVFCPHNPTWLCFIFPLSTPAPIISLTASINTYTPHTFSHRLTIIIEKKRKKETSLRALLLYCH